MSPLISELAGEEFAQKLKNAELSAFKVFRNENKIELGIKSSQIIDKKTEYDLIEKIKALYGAKDVCVVTEYEGFGVTSENVLEVFEHIKQKVIEKVPSCKSLLLKSSATLSENNFIIHTKFGGESTLLSNKIDVLFKDLLSGEFGVDFTVSFKNDMLDTKTIRKDLEAEESTISSDIKLPEPPPKKETVQAIKTEEEGDDGVLLGKAIKGEITPISEIPEYGGQVIVSGRVVGKETRELSSGKTLLEFYVADKDSAIICKAFVQPHIFEKIKPNLKKIKAITVQGMAQYDSFAKEVTITAKNIMLADIKVRKDEAEVKRVELHAHTSLSAMDGIVKPDELIGRALKWGHKAIAITDHGVAQAFPEVFHAAGKTDLKVIYGVEGYLEGENPKGVYGETDSTLSDTFVVFDIETTGFSAEFNEIIEIGAVKVENGKITDRFSEFVKPENPIPYRITELTAITQAMVEDAQNIENVLPQFIEFCGDAPLVAHNAKFDMGFIRKKAENLGLKTDFCYIDTLFLSRALLTALKKHKLDVVAKHLGFAFQGHHRAVNDAEVTTRIFLYFIDTLKQMGINSVNEINEKLPQNTNKRFIDSFHIILLAKTQEGLKNLYRLISFSHLNNFYKKPRISKEMLEKHREGLIVGSACEAGELYSKLVSGALKPEIQKIIDFYDYLEIQPLGNNDFMVRNETVSSIEQLKDLNRKIVELGKENDKPVVATCDVHFLDREDKIYREILMSAQDYDDAENQPPLYLRTTDEMLKEFEYLGKDTAYEVVVKNTNLIADMVDIIRPVPKDAYPPEMPGATEELKELCNKKLLDMYGENPPEIVTARMEKELVPIIKYGFSVMYMIAQKLVAKSNSDGYLVGSRGSVGSSLVAFLSGITEINSLPPHYRCEKCKNTEFFTDGTYACGADMPDKVCPVCGASYKKDGYDIPFETFLGFDGDKAPDIDLNFSGDYQSTAHKYTEVLFGEGNVFRAGTIGTVAENTAIGYIKKHGEKIGKNYTKAQTMSLLSGLVGIKRTTGQHPGGIIIVPRANEVYEFTPVQHPADDTETDIITTHFDYHSIDQNLLKLDILGHDDPTVIRMLEDLTGIDAKTIPLDDQATMSIFNNTEALGIKPEDINSEVGTFAVPEFGTKFVRQMLVDTKPTAFSELVRISGLSHGTDVWTNNAQNLVRDGVATLSEVICTRDDIMIYLIQHGVPNLTSFTIMEKVRKGKGLTPEDESIMREHNVPEWYIDSCKKIKYMFPKAHAAAYVTMAFRIAYFKVNYPVSFYISYYTVRADAFDAKRMIHGKERVIASMKEIENNPDATQKEKDVHTILEVCNEMYARGIKFLPIDLYKSHSNKFLEEDGAIRPPLNAIAGLSDAMAQSILKAREEGEFISVEDLARRTKIGNSIIEKLKEYDVLTDMAATNQTSLFD